MKPHRTAGATHEEPLPSMPEALGPILVCVLAWQGWEAAGVLNLKDTPLPLSSKTLSCLHPALWCHG